MNDQESLYGTYDMQVGSDGVIDLGPYAEIFTGMALLRFPIVDDPFVMILTERQDAAWVKNLAESIEIIETTLAAKRANQGSNSADEARLARMRQMLSEQTAVVSVNSNGLLSVPGEVLEFAKLKPGDDATLLGNHDHLELWRSDLFEESMANIDLFEMLFGDA